MKIFYFIILFLTSCMFEGVDRVNSIQNVLVEINKKNETNFNIKKILESKFNALNNVKPEYKLLINTSEDTSASGLASNASTSNFNLEIKVTFKLYRVQDNKIIFSGSLTEDTNYLSGSSKIIAEYISSKSARQNISKILAEKIYEDIQNHFAFNTNEI